MRPTGHRHTSRSARLIPSCLAGFMVLASTYAGAYATPAPVTSPAQPALTLTYLANMGVGIDTRGGRVVVDGFHHGALAQYASLRDQDRVALEGARPPWQALSAILVTHRHLDHFQAASVNARLSVDPAVVFVAPQEVIDTLSALNPRWSTDARVRPAQAGVAMRIGALTITPLDLPHNATRTRLATNVGYLLEVDGKRILHVGDADPNVATYRRAREIVGALDVAIVPFWYMGASNTALRSAIGARRYVASHVPLADTTAVRAQVRGVDSTAYVLGTRGQRLVLP